MNWYKKAKLEIQLNNGQSNPYVEIDDGEESVRIYFCSDGGIIQGHEKSIGVDQGARKKENQADFDDAPAKDGIKI